MNLHFPKLIYLLCFLTALGAKAQNTLTLETAVKRALATHLGIKTQAISVEQAKNNVTRGNAGMLPNVNFVAGLTPSISYTDQKLSTGAEISRVNPANNINAGVQLSWTLYDGRRMTIAFDRLGAQRDVAMLNLQVRAEGIVTETMKAFYNIVRQQQTYTILQNQMSLYVERVRLAESRLDVGKGNGLDVLQAKSDLQTQKTALLRQANAIELAKQTLYQTIEEGRGSADFERITDTLFVNLSDTLSRPYDATRNINVRLANQQIRVSDYLYEEVKTLKKPRLTLNSAFNLNRADNAAGIILLNQNAGLNAGLSLTMPIYDGNNINRQITNANLDRSAASEQMEETKLIVENNVRYWTLSKNAAIHIVKSEDENVALAQQSIEIAMERFRLGRANVLELRQIQKSYEDVLLRRIAALYEAKIAEIELQRWRGELTK
jgi:outer membrane protein